MSKTSQKIDTHTRLGTLAFNKGVIHGRNGDEFMYVYRNSKHFLVVAYRIGYNLGNKEMIRANSTYIAIIKTWLKQIIRKLTNLKVI